MNPTGAKREGYMRGSVLATKNGFTKSTALHRYGNDVEPTNMIRSMNSYQARSVSQKIQAVMQGIIIREHMSV